MHAVALLHMRTFDQFWYFLLSLFSDTIPIFRFFVVSHTGSALKIVFISESPFQHFYLPILTDKFWRSVWHIFWSLTFLKSIQTLQTLGLEYIGVFLRLLGRLLQLEKLVKIRLYFAFWAVFSPYFLGLSTLKWQVSLKSSMKTGQINRDYEKNTHFEVFKLQLAD